MTEPYNCGKARHGNRLNLNFILLRYHFQRWVTIDILPYFFVTTMGDPHYEFVLPRTITNIHNFTGKTSPMEIIRRVITALLAMTSTPFLTTRARASAYTGSMSAAAMNAWASMR